MCLQDKKRQGTLGAAEARREAPSVWDLKLPKCEKTLRGRLFRPSVAVSYSGHRTRIQQSENKNDMWKLGRGKRQSSRQRLEIRR